MRRRIVLLAGGLAAAAGLILLPQAQAQSACLTAYVEVNGEVVVDDGVCLPPEAPAPEPPAVPQLP
jgi:hypothetical protein